jgi:hypothetical protein
VWGSDHIAAKSVTESIFEALGLVRILYQNPDSDLLESLYVVITWARPIDRCDQSDNRHFWRNFYHTNGVFAFDRADGGFCSYVATTPNNGFLRASHAMLLLVPPNSQFSCS